MCSAGGLGFALVAEVAEDPCDGQPDRDDPAGAQRQLQSGIVDVVVDRLDEDADGECDAGHPELGGPCDALVVDCGPSTVEQHHPERHHEPCRHPAVQTVGFGQHPVGRCQLLLDLDEVDGRGGRTADRNSEHERYDDVRCGRRDREPARQSPDADGDENRRHPLSGWRVVQGIRHRVGPDTRNCVEHSYLQ